ncbi:acyltransferase family protein [Mitsuokella multacida]|uniref:acyltransferase family protein n=1 Tax=Mitsuokella multacida TaxID=52226 RepID=UPI0022E0D8BE|nr:acyltransferase family protein [Mitsuokella multacida]
MPYLSWAMWFIPVYLLVMAIIPVLKQVFLSEAWQIRIFPAVFFPSLVALFQWMGWQEHKLLWETAFYAFWVYAGFFFIRYIHEKSAREKLFPCLTGTIIGLALTVAVFCSDFGSLDMQANKFPPNIIFFCYTFGIMSIVVFLIEPIHHFIQCLQKNSIFNWIFSVYRDNCYSVYLYHPFAFLILKGVLHLLHLDSFLHQYPILLTVVCYPLLLVMAAVIARFFSPLEKLKRIKI